MSLTFLTESTKFKVVPAPTQVPGTCASCGASDNSDRQYIDFGFTLDYYGVFYLCTFCFTECANAIGFISPEQSRNMEELLEVAEKKVLDFYTKDKALNDAISLLRDSGLFDLVDGPAGLTNEIATSAVDSSPVQDDSGINQDKLDFGEQTTEQGSSDVSTVRDDEFRSALEL